MIAAHALAVGEENTPNRHNRPECVCNVPAIPLQDAVFEIAEVAGRDEEMDAFYAAIHGIVRRLTSAESFFIALLHEQDNCVTFPYFKEPTVNAFPAASVPLEEVQSSTLTSLVLRERGVVHLGDQDFPEVFRDNQIVISVGDVPNQWLGVPLLKGEDLLGALVVQSFDSDFEYSDEDKRLLVYVAQHIAAALQRKSDRLSLLSAHKQLKDQNAELSKTNQRLKKVLQERAAIQRTLQHNATHDALTGLPNRALFVTQLQQMLENPDHSFAVLFLDLDRFKVVNDSLGHLAGDSLLQEVAERLKAAIRHNDIVARFGGDEFCVLLDGLEGEQTLHNAATRILKSFRKPIQLSEQPVVISTSIGATIGPDGYVDTEEILRDADTALYSAKANGKAQYRIFDEKLRQIAVDRMQLEQDLRTAILTRRLEVHYQPIIDTTSRRVVAVESLVRWRHPVLGSVSPSRFLPIAEETGLISHVTEFVLTECARRVTCWRQMIPGCEDLIVNVNVSSCLLERYELQRKIRNLLQTNHLEASALKIEVTESAFLSNYETATEVLREVSALGVGIALDDFGTGYSSLTYIHDLPIDEIKIDLSFVRNVHTNARSHAIVQTINALANVLGLSVTAEGVETEEQYRSLQGLKVGRQQGYYFGRPADAVQTEMMLRSAAGSRVFGNPRDYAI